jgi:hypothetical protein
MRRSPFIIGHSLLALLAACATPLAQYQLRDLALSCDDTNRATYRTLDALGFTVTDFTPAASGGRGKAKGARGPGPHGGAQNVTVDIECTPAGANVDASEDGKVLRQIDFKRAFYLSFTAGVKMDERRREMDAKVAQGSAPASQQRQGLQVKIEPIRGQAAKLDLELDMAAAGVLPVRIQVNNPTEQRYELDPGEVRLQRADRERVGPISVAEVAALIAKGKDPDSDKPLSSLSSSELSAKLQSKLFTATFVQPRSDATGYLFFPLADYKRARIVLTEAGSEEAEGFAVEF